jgi:hypothetical protein
MLQITEVGTILHVKITEVGTILRVKITEVCDTP